MILEILSSGSKTTVTISRQIQGVVKGGAYSSSRSLKQGVWGTAPLKSFRVTLFLKSKNDATMKFGHIIITVSVK